MRISVHAPNGALGGCKAALCRECLLREAAPPRLTARQAAGAPRRHRLRCWHHLCLPAILLRQHLHNSQEGLSKQSHATVRMAMHRCMCG